jgi:ribonuclease Z
MRSVFFPHLVNGPFGDPALYVRLAHQGKALLFDCGDLHPLTTREILKLEAVFLSHAHIDHLAGFDALLRCFLCREGSLQVFGPPGIADRIGHRLGGYTWNLTAGYPFVLTVREWGDPRGRSVRFRASRGFVPEPAEPFPCPDGLLLETPSFRVRCVPLDHGGIVSLGFALEETLHVAIHKEALAREGLAPGPWLRAFKEWARVGGDGNEVLAVRQATGEVVSRSAAELLNRIAHIERGMKLVYVTDVAPHAANARKIVELAGGAQLLVIEATFSAVDRDRAEARSHLTAQLAGELGRRAGASRLLVFHHSPRYQETPDLLRQEAEAAFVEAKSPDG